ncbi:beta-glucosidase BglX [Massilibacteroides sp.]|uniref:beta-glucosidase BglX n=1 Tax=Massilibacteroides sp. TaxID=2034766 RepID=UPI0026028AAD|nr:beta-glucosidase BglX [Massilibacteroides sp.]MDD4516255.1 beta-glucosidase BglX [Massilibacteroides sp.]
MKTVKILSACLFLVFWTSCTQESKTKGDPTIEQKVEALLSQMTLEEKVGQMNQISPSSDLTEVAELIKKGEVGSVLNLVDPKAINALQQVAMEETRLKIPLIVGRDVIHGFKTIFPIPLGQAASFNPELVEEGAHIAAIEASSQGVHWTFAPMIDIARDARWGRIAESLGEDTYLTSTLGAAMVRGFQGKDLSDPTSIAACPKHFVGYGAAESGKDYNSTFIPERTLRNVYLPSFKAAVDAGAATFMTSFNDNDGVPSTGNQFILKEVLRKEWNFNGFVVSDWASVTEMIAHGFAKDGKEAAMKAINAGVDMEMVSYSYVTYVKELLDEKKITMQTIDNAVRNILRIKMRLGLFENPYVDVDAPSVLYTAEHLQKAKEAAIESAILLKNDNGTLPLNETIRTIAVVGPLADAPHDQLGTWIFDGDKNYTQTPLKALQKEYGDKVRILYAPGLAYSRDVKTDGIAAAVQAARNADVVLAFVGEESILSGEAHSLADLNLQGAQSELIAAVAKTGKPVVTIVMAGRPLTIGRDADVSQAVLFNFHPGTMGGPAIADLLFGKAVPSGKLPVTFPKMVGQLPIYYSHNNTGRPYQGNETMLADIPLEAGQTSLGNTSFHLDAGAYPLYPFGYGLSYTTFSYANLNLSSDKLKATDTLTVSADITNTGKYDGTEIVQLYVQDCFGSVTRPVKELKDFTRIFLKSGETKTVTFTLPIQKLAYYNIDMDYVVEAGDFNLWVSQDSQKGLKASFVVE